MRYGTLCFPSEAAAVRYYSKLGLTHADVLHKIGMRDITIGKPKLQPGDRLVLIDRRTRYAIEDDR